MEELINLVAEKSGLPKAQAEKAVNAVLEVLEEKLPAPLASQIKPALENEGVLDNAENLLDKGLNLFGKK
jgi:nucleoid DNA-binding protein